MSRNSEGARLVRESYVGSKGGVNESGVGRITRKIAEGLPAFGKRRIWRTSLERDFYFSITSGCGCVHGGHDSLHVAAQSGPLLIAQDHKRDLPALQILLVTHVFVVSRISKPSASAAAIRSPLTSRSHPRSIASTIVCPFRASRSGAGVPLSKSMSIGHVGGRRDRRRVEAPRSEFDHGHNLFTR